MALFRYFKREKGNLPDPHGPLARSVPSTSIAGLGLGLVLMVASYHGFDFEVTTGHF